MAVRIRSIKELGRYVRIAGETVRKPKRVPVPRAPSPPQVKLWQLVKREWPEAEQERGGLVEGRRYTVDIVIERLKLCIELDGWTSHGRYLKGFLRDREKDRELLIAGYRTARFTAGEVIKEPEKVIDILRRIVWVLESEKEN